MKTLGERLKYIRNSKLKMTQKEFAEFIGIPQSSLSSYETNKTIPTTEIIILIAEKSNISLDWLCGLKTKVKKKKRNTSNLRCCTCNKRNESNEKLLIYENNIYCGDCFISMNEFNLTCCKCGYEKMEYEKFIEVDGIYYCEYCAVEEFEINE